MHKNLLRKGFVVGIIVLLISFAILPATGIVVNKNSKLEEQQFVVEESSTYKDNNVDWWPKFHHDLQNTGYSTSTAPTTNNILWTYETGFMIHSSPAIVEEKVYIGSDDEKFYCLDADTGEKLWDYSIPGGTSLSSPAVYDGKVYVGTSDYIYCWNANTGNLVWKFPNEYGPSRSPAVVNGKVYITTYYGGLFCLDAETGEDLWIYNIGGYELSSPAFYDGKVYIGSGNSILYCFYADNGTVHWMTQNYGGVGSPAIFEGKIYSGFNGIHCLHANNGTKIWSYSDTTTYSSPAVANDKVYFVSSQPNAGVHCLDAETGDLIWYYYTSNYEYCFSSPAIAADKVYVGLWSNGKLICLDADTGEFIWEYQVGGSEWLFSSPAVANGIVYMGASLYKVYAFGGYDAPPETPEQPSGPTEGEPGEEYSYSTYTTDPEDDMVQYRFDWDANGLHDISSWSNFVPSGTSVSMSHAWNISGTFMVKAQARDEHYALSNWSEGLTVVITGNAPPNAPSNPDPPDGATDVDIDADLSWTCSDPDGDDLTYDVYFGTDSDPPLFASDISETSYDPGTMYFDETYYWKIIAEDVNGASTPGPIWHFTTSSGPNNPPYPPSNPDPPNGTIDCDIDIDLSWTGGDPDEDDTVVYDVYLETNNPEPTILVSDDQPETTFDPGTLNHGTNYYWKVYAKDNHNRITKGPIWHFTTEEADNNPPGVPTITGKLKGNSGKSYEYTFNTVDPDEDNVKYYIDWDDGDSDETGLNPSGEDVKVKHTWDSDGTYTIRAYAEDEFGLVGPEGTLTVTMPRNRATYNSLFLWFLEQFPILQKILCYFL